MWRLLVCLLVCGCSGSSGKMSSADLGGVDLAKAASPDLSTKSGALPAGWLYTDGNLILSANGQGSGTQWMGRGVNVDDIFFCGFNNTLSMTGSDTTLSTILTNLITSWKPSFLRISLSMDSNTTMASWTANDAQYKTPMTNVINTVGAHAGVYVLVTLRSHASMILQDTADGDAEATGLPSDATSTPDATAFPTGTDATYQALVDTFAQSKFVLFGLTNEPGGNKRSNTQISSAMSHAVSVIRAEEDKLGVPHHLVSVQGNGWTSDISFYAQQPLGFDNVVYEVHGYPPSTSSYTYANIPVILGEYGSLDSSSQAAFYADLEDKAIPNLAWDFDPYNNCAPDLVDTNMSTSNFTPTTWGQIVKSYLASH
jgi:Cellulase (glycosyl hydrolase family 5)